jgi:hypothetical protein
MKVKRANRTSGGGLQFILQPRPKKGFFARRKDGLVSYGEDLAVGLLAYPKAVIDGGARVRAELETQSASERAFGRKMLWVWALIAVVGLGFWLTVRGLLGPIPLLVAGYFWYVHPERVSAWIRERDERRAASRGNRAGADGEHRTIPVTVLRELAINRLRAASDKIKAWERLDKEERRVEAPGVASEIQKLLGEEFARMYENAVEAESRERDQHEQVERSKPQDASAETFATAGPSARDGEAVSTHTEALAPGE